MRGLRRLALATVPSSARRFTTAAPALVFSSHPLHADACNLLRAAGLELDAPLHAAETPLPRHEVQRRASRASGFIAFMPDCVTDSFVAACPHLRVVSGVLRGPDNFDVLALTARGVHFTLCANLLTAPTAELAVGLAIALARRLREGDARVRGGGFAGWRAELFGRSLHGAEVGVIGLGAVGRQVAALVRAFGASRVSYADAASESSDPFFQRLPDAAAVVASSDFIFPLTPLSSATRHIINSAVLARARPHAMLVNVGRGGCVDEDAVACALAEGRLAGYAADVFELEDWLIEDRRRSIPSALLADGERTLFTPHLGSAVVDVRRSMDCFAAESVVDVLVRGVPPRGAVNADLVTRS
jgi:phosphonate dehydrogenase